MIKSMACSFGSSYLLGCSGYLLGRFFDLAFANSLGLKTLNHGTNLCNYLSIRVFGADPSRGGIKTGSTYTSFTGSQPVNNKFYVFKDSSDTNSKGYYRIFQPTFFLPVAHACLSGSNIFHGFNPVFKVISGVFHAFISPTLRFRYSSVDKGVFENDRDYDYYDSGNGSIAYFTEKKIEPYKIGFIGSIIEGAKGGWSQRLKENPLKIAKGVIQLAAVVSLCYSLYTRPFELAIGFSVGLLA